MTIQLKKQNGRAHTLGLWPADTGTAARPEECPGSGAFPAHRAISQLPGTTLRPPVSGASGAVLARRVYAWCGSARSLIADDGLVDVPAGPVPVRYRRPRTQFVEL